MTLSPSKFTLFRLLHLVLFLLHLFIFFHTSSMFLFQLSTVLRGFLPFSGHFWSLIVLGRFSSLVAAHSISQWLFEWKNFFSVLIWRWFLQCCTHLLLPLFCVSCPLAPVWTMSLCPHCRLISIFLRQWPGLVQVAAFQEFPCPTPPIFPRRYCPPVGLSLLSPFFSGHFPAGLCRPFAANSRWGLTYCW